MIYRFVLNDIFTIFWGVLSTLFMETFLKLERMPRQSCFFLGFEINHRCKSLGYSSEAFLEWVLVDSKNACNFLLLCLSKIPLLLAYHVNHIMQMSLDDNHM